MEMVLIFSETETFTLVIIKMENQMVTGNIFGQTVVATLVILKMDSSMVKESGK